MTLSKLVNKMSESYWHPDDKNWMKERKEKWRDVKLSLDVISHGYTPLKRKYHKYHKELFFTGVVNDEVRNPYVVTQGTSGYVMFDSALPLFEVWYHPEVEKLDLNRILLAYIKNSTMDRLREALFMNIFRTSCDPSLKMFSPATGMMNGREKHAVELVCPGFDFKEIVSATLNPNQSSGQSVCAHPRRLEHFLKRHTRLELLSDARFIPYAPGQYLWHHFSYAMEKYPEKIFDTSSTNKTYDELKNEILEIIAHILAFEKRTDKSRHRPSTIAMVEYLIGQYEAKSFSDPMLKLWEEAKLNLNNLIDKCCSFNINLNQEELEKYHAMPINYQNERISQWKQV